MTSTIRLFLMLGLLICAACARKPQGTQISRALALRWQEPMTIRVLYVYDRMRVHLPGWDPEVSHVVDVRVLEGPERWQDRTLALPFDNWAVSGPLPRQGDTLTISPALWVMRSRENRGIPGR